MAKRRRSRGRPVNGIVVVDKLKGASSNEVLQRVKRIFGAAKAGHTGSLDPLATGVLPVCLGEATKFSQFLLDSDKSYRTSVRLGIKTTTGDAEGEVVEQRPVQITRSDIEAVLVDFQGEIEQVPSMYSALKYKGQPLYKLAREGIEVERPARRVSIYRIELLEFSGDHCVLDVDCSKGTYIRTLAEDIGERLGCLAHVAELRRLKAGPYDQQEAYSLEALEAIRAEGREKALSADQSEWLDALFARVDEAGRDSLEDDEQQLKALSMQRSQGGNRALDALLLPLDSAVSHYPEVHLGANSSFYILQGQPVLVPNAPTCGYVRIYSQADEGFLGIGEILDDGRVAPKRLVRSAA